jgi:hypothetical protein
MQTVRSENLRLTMKRLDAGLGVSSRFEVLSGFVKRHYLRIDHNFQHFDS